LVPSQMKRLAPDDVVVRPLKERVMVVTAAMARNDTRHHPIVDAAVKWIARAQVARVHCKRWSVKDVCYGSEADPCSEVSSNLRPH